MPATLLNFLLVGLAGALGAMTRYAVGLAFSRPYAFWGTLLINVTGSFFLGWFATVVEREGFPEHLRVAVAVGFVGAYTTFSTYMLESDTMLRGGAWVKAAAYLSVSLFLGLAAVRLGVLLARRG